MIHVLSTKPHGVTLKHEGDAHEIKSRLFSQLEMVPDHRIRMSSEMREQIVTDYNLAFPQNTDAPTNEFATGDTVIVIGHSIRKIFVVED